MANDPYDNILKPEKILLLVREFIDEHNITTPDVIEQSDRLIEDTPDFIESLCKAAGYTEPEYDEEEEDISIGDYDEDNPLLEDEY